MINDPNREILLLIAKALDELRDQVIFVGGCATGLLVTLERAQVIRPTDDVDIVAQVMTTAEYHQLEAQLRSKGFEQDMSADAPICRWRYKGIAVDVMPTDEKILGFANRWYPLSTQTAEWVTLNTEVSIRLISAPAFIATKLEAFTNRGKGDMLLSHDLEDIVTVVDGRPSLISEIGTGPRALREYIAKKFSILVTDEAFLSALAGHLPGDAASQARLPTLERKLNALAHMVD